MAKQGRPDIKGPLDQKVEPNAKAVNPGAVSYLGNKLGNHTMEGGDMTLRPTPWSDGRGYMAPSIGKKRWNSGSQGEY